MTGIKICAANVKACFGCNSRPVVALHALACSSAWILVDSQIFPWNLPCLTRAARRWSNILWPWPWPSQENPHGEQAAPRPFDWPCTTVDGHDICLLLSVNSRAPHNLTASSNTRRLEPNSHSNRNISQYHELVAMKCQSFSVVRYSIRNKVAWTTGVLTDTFANAYTIILILLLILSHWLIHCHICCVYVYVYVYIYIYIYYRRELSWSWVTFPDLKCNMHLPSWS